MEADSAGSARAEPAESAWTGFQSLTQKSPTVISRIETYLPVSENPIQKYWKPKEKIAFAFQNFQKNWFQDMAVFM